MNINNAIIARDLFRQQVLARFSPTDRITMAVYYAPLINTMFACDPSPEAAAVCADTILIDLTVPPHPDDEPELFDEFTA